MLECNILKTYQDDPMKYVQTFSFLVCLFVFSGCVHKSNPPQVSIAAPTETSEQRETREACNELAIEFKKDSVWDDTCRSDPQVMYTYTIKHYEAAPVGEICSKLFLHYKDTVFVKMIEPIESKRKINCDKNIYDKAVLFMNEQNAGDLCQAWYNHTGYPAYIRAIDDSVKRRNVNCETLISGMQTSKAIEQQAEAQRQQAIALQDQALAQQRQADALKSAAQKSITCTPDPYGAFTCR